MSDEQTYTPPGATDQPFVDPLDGLMSGAYRARADGAPDDEPDHLVVYLRAPDGDRRHEYRGQAAICGRPVSLVPKLEQVGPTCEFCLTDAEQAFRRGRAALAAGGEEDR